VFGEPLEDLCHLIEVLRLECRFDLRPKVAEQRLGALDFGLAREGYTEDDERG
jgi:hypothetical protein